MTDLRQAAQALLNRWDSPLWNNGSIADAIADLRTALEQQAEPECWCHNCNENRLVNNIPFSMTRMILCPKCGNKRCPKASDHRLGCTDSNAAGQPGSAYPALPRQKSEPVAPKCGAIIEVFDKDWRLEYLSLPVGKHKLYVQQYTYTTPPQRKPLTDEAIEQAQRDVWRSLPSDFDYTTSSWIEIGIRYAEAAHGIKENT